MQVSLNSRQFNGIMKALKTMPQKVQNKALRNAVGKAMTPASRAIRKEAPKDTGALKRSIGKRTKTYQRGTVAAAVVGPRKSFEKNGRKPSRYAHIVENGKAGQRANRYMQRGWDGSVREVEATVRKTILDNIVKAWRAGK